MDFWSTAQQYFPRRSSHEERGLKCIELDAVTVFNIVAPRMRSVD